MSDIKIHKQFVAVGDRRVLVRYAGTGPAIVLLHQSPQNSRAMIPWIARLASKYAVFAPDTPGFGDSDPLPLAQATIPDFAAALAQLFAALKLDRALIFGVHTGAVTALRFAIDFPQHVAALICDGYSRFDALEREAMWQNYLPPFEPQWDGGHLTWLFARLREQHLFFPWHDGRKEMRLAYPMPSAARLHGDTMDVLDAGDYYRAGYRAAFLYDDVNAAARLTPPAFLFYRAEDVLGPHIFRLPALPKNVVAEQIIGGPTALIASTDAVFEQFSDRASSIDCVSLIANAASTSRIVFDTTWGEIACRVVAGRGEEIVIAINDLGMPALSPVLRDTAATMLLPDLPGHGASSVWDEKSVAPENIAHAYLTLIDALKINRIAVIGIGGGAVIASLLTMMLGNRCLRLELQDPLALDANQASTFLANLPDPTIQNSGGHLLAAWNFVRAQYLFWPWLPADGIAARKVAAPSAQRVQLELLEVLRAGVTLKPLWREVLLVDLAATLATLTIPLKIISSADDEHIRMASLLATTLKLEKSMSHEPCWNKPGGVGII